MSEREKVIKGLECSIGIRGSKNCDDCPYDYDFNCIGCDIVLRDAIALLKEQEPRLMDGSHCPSCNFSFGWTVDELGGTGNVNYCPHCGQAVKWDD